MSSFSRQLSSRLLERKEQSLYRHRKILNSPQSTEIIVEGKKLLSFCSNDYLGLANHPDVIVAFKNGLDLYGVGSGASHLITGHSAAHHELEEALAEFTGRSRALLFSSGYMANMGVITTLLGKKDYLFEDKLNHASLIEGGLFSGARFQRYPHLNTDSLSQQLEKANQREVEDEHKPRKLIISDGVFSMDGDVAPLEELIKLANKNDAQLMIDDAHGFGCLGKDGGGLVSSLQETGFEINESNLQILVGTLGKAFGTSGAFVAGSEELIETLIQFCRPYIYTTAMAPALAVASLCSLKILQKEHWRREHLNNMVVAFRKRCEELGFTLTNSQTPVQAIIFGKVETALKSSQVLEQQGIMVSAIRPPTVPMGSSRLRITLSAAHTEKQLSILLNALELIIPFAKSEN